MEAVYWLIDWLLGHVRRYPPPALDGMRLGPVGRKENALMVCFCPVIGRERLNSHCCSQLQFFTWESKHPSMSWWSHFESEAPVLAEMGVTQVWLPPPNKAMSKVRDDAEVLSFAYSNSIVEWPRL